MKKLLLITIAFISLFTTCKDPESDFVKDNPNNIGYTNNTNNTFVVLNNMLGQSAVTVYDDYQRRESDKIITLPAGKLSEPIEWLSGEKTFYFRYHLSFKGINGFVLDYVPSDVGRGQTAARIDANITTEILVPKLEDTVTSPDQLFSNNSFIILENNADFHLRLQIGNTPLYPLSSPDEAKINAKETAYYKINPGFVSSYNILSGVSNIPFPVTLTNFEAGIIYRFNYGNNSLLFISETKLILENIQVGNVL